MIYRNSNNKICIINPIDFSTIIGYSNYRYLILIKYCENHPKLIKKEEDIIKDMKKIEKNILNSLNYL